MAPKIDPAGLADYWSVYTDHYDEIQAELMKAAARVEAFRVLLESMDPQVQAAQAARSFELQRAAVVDGQWGPYLEDLRMQGQIYAAQGIEFSAWYDLVAPFRTIAIGFVADRFADDGPRLARAIEALDQLTDVGMRELGQAYVDEARRRLQTAHAQLEQRNETLEEFAYAASHDLKEPMRQVSLFAELLQSRIGDQLESRDADALQYIVDGAARMLELAAALLEHTRTDGAELTLESVDLGEVFRESVADLRRVLESTGADLLADTLPTVRGDRALLGRIFFNLISNAIKFARPDVAPTIRVRAAQTEDGWRIEVADTGTGIPRAHRERVFRVFSRLRPNDSEGTGIGLAICRRAVQRHGGRMWIEDNKPEGSVFVFTLPRDPAPLTARA